MLSTEPGAGHDPEVQQWLKTRIQSTEYGPTLNAIKVRIDGFMSDSLFRTMFRAPRNKFDLFDAMQGAKVIVVNTNKALLKGNTEAFGRFFIAKLLQATEERMLIGKGQRLPVYAYLDEATDYIAEEENIAELIDKARKQRVGLILANQRVEQVKSSNVLSALNNVGIRCQVAPARLPTDLQNETLDRLRDLQKLATQLDDLEASHLASQKLREIEYQTHTPPFSWLVNIGNDAPILWTPPRTDFATMERMTDGEWTLMLDHMHQAYSVDPRAPDDLPSATEPSDDAPPIVFEPKHPVPNENSDAKFWQVWKK